MFLSFDYAIHNLNKKDFQFNNFLFYKCYLLRINILTDIYAILNFTCHKSSQIQKSFLLSKRGFYILHLCYFCISFSFNINLTCINFLRYIPARFFSSLVLFQMVYIDTGKQYYGIKSFSLFL